MPIHRRTFLSGVAATVAAPFPAVSKTALASATVASAPISLAPYYFLHRKQPIWPDHFAEVDFLPFLRSHRWHFDGCTYDEPLIYCPGNNRVFKVHRSQSYGTMVFEFWLEGPTQGRTRDWTSEALAGAARHTAAWACRSSRYVPEKGWPPVYIDGHKGAVYIDFPDDPAAPVTADAPPLLIHDRLDPARPLIIDEDFTDDESDQSEDQEPA